MSTINNLEWRYATKAFDSSKKVSDSDMEQIYKAIQLSPTSYGLQLFKVIEVSSPELRAKLQPASWGQSQIVDASHLLVFCYDTSVADEKIDKYLQLKSEIQKIPSEHLTGYGDFMKGKMKEQTPESIQRWNEKQTYIALGNAMSMAAELKIDTCPIEGFSPEEYNQILGLSQMGLSAAVVLAVGYRAESDATQAAPKVRKPISEMIVSM